MILAAAALHLGACGDPSAPGRPPADTTVTSLRIVPDTGVSLAPQAMLQLKAEGSKGSGWYAVTPGWSSSDTTVVKVSTAGLLQALRGGTATVRATLGSASSALSVNVTASNLRITPEPVGVLPGDTVRLSAQRYAQGGWQSTTATWSSLDTSLATVSTAGVVHAVRAGVVTIRAQASGATADARVAVVGDPACVNRSGSSTGPRLILGDISLSGTIAAGAIYCIAPEAHLNVVGSLVVGGTAAQPAVFTPLIPGKPWGGFVVAQASADISGSIIREAVTGVSALNGAGATLRNVVMQRVGTGYWCWRAGFSATGLHIEYSGAGLVLGVDNGHWCTVGTMSGIALVGGPQPGRGGLADFVRLLTEPTDTITGPGTWVVPPGFDKTMNGDFTLPPGLMLMIENDYGTVGTIGGHGALILSPGSMLNVSAVQLGPSVRIAARGTPSQPVLIFASFPAMLGGQPGQPSIFSHVRITGTGARIDADSGRPLVLDSSSMTGTGLYLRARGSHVLASTIENAGSPQLLGWQVDSDSTAVLLAADSVFLSHTTVLRSAGRGVRITAPGVMLDHCEVSGAARDGIAATVADRVQIHNCNLFNNVGVGVRNTATATLDAASNWWGDPAGPTGANGDGVAGNVDASNPLAAPVTVGTAAPAAAAARVSRMRR